MSTITFTSYVDADTTEVESRVSGSAGEAPDGAVVRVEPFVDRSQLVVTVPWSDTNEADRSTSTLKAARFMRAIERMAFGS